ncbi:Nucleic acid-binding, OB-fold [Sesbania bispinosa]|nr:Nucleic acid-binding, OB-fold [Sesbania bispinosa]
MEGGSAIDVDNRQEKEEEDPFLRFVEYARSELLSLEDDSNGDGSRTAGCGWSWIVSRILKTCIAYSSGVTPAILLSELSQAWIGQRRVGAPKKRHEVINHLKKNHRRTKLPNTVTIDSICEKNFLSLNSVLEAVIIDAFVLPGTNIHMLTLGDYWSSNIIDLYLHRRFYDLAGLQNGILKKGREVFLTGCYLRTATEGSGHPRLLPTEYLVILLDEDQDDDAMLLGAQFCSDSFSSISLDAVNKGASYSLYARIESIESAEIQGSFGPLQRQQITLVDGDGVALKFLLWGEQTILANLFSVGSMLALDKPYVASSVECDIETTGEFYLEYGSATQLYLVPYIQHEEQVCVTLTPNSHPSQGLRFSQVSLPCDSQGTIDFSNYPFRSFVVDLRNKMTGISLYGVVTDIIKEDNIQETVFSLRIADTSGEIRAKLHFGTFWSLGRVSLGHTVFISGLTCTPSKQKRLEVSWFENGSGASFINLSCLPALINSSCLHKLSPLSDISYQTSYAQVCRVWLDPIKYYYVNTRFSHSLCGHFVNKMPGGFFECSFCHISCDAEIVRTFHLKITLSDDSSTKILAWCTGQTAMDLLQISPEEFYDLPEEEQLMYPSSLENERFVVALVNCKRDGCVTDDLLPDDSISWEITRAYKCE